MKRKTLVIILIILSFSSYSQDDLFNLFYENENVPISKLHFVSSDLALGVRMENPNSYRVKDLILLNENRIIIDSLDVYELIIGAGSGFCGINKFTSISNSNVYIQVCENAFVHLEISKAGISLISHGIEEAAKKMTGAVSGTYPKIGISYLKNNKKDSKNFPHFTVHKLGEEENLETFKINRSQKVVSDNLFLDVKDFNLVSDRTNTFAAYFILYEDEIFFNVPRENACYIFNIENHNIERLGFPDIENSESVFIYIDAFNGKKYLVKKDKDSAYSIYQLYQKSLRPTTKISFFPQQIIDDKIYEIRERKEKGKTIISHYLHPLYEEGSIGLELDEVSVESTINN